MKVDTDPRSLLVVTWVKADMNTWTDKEEEEWEKEHWLSKLKRGMYIYFTFFISLVRKPSGESLEVQMSYKATTQIRPKRHLRLLGFRCKST